MNYESKSGKAKFYILFLAYGSLVLLYVVLLKVVEPIDVVQ